MKEKKKDAIHRTRIGGQALIEGIMMRGVDKAAMAVRKKDGEIDVEVWDIPNGKWYQKAPFIRGPINFVTQMADGFRYISKSAEKSGMMDDDGEELSKFEKWLNDKFGDKLMGALIAVASFLGVALALVLFICLPTWIFTGIQTLLGDTDISMFRSLFEGVLKIIIFIVYLWLTSKLKDIARTYEYHGAEHKTIATYEAGEELTVENIKKHKRFHPRCGTSFIFLVLAISILVYSIVPINSELFVEWWGVAKAVADLIRIGFKLLFLPVIVSISYEVIRIAGRYDNIVTKIISAPGLALQRLTTREPDASQIEVAIASVMPVIPENKELDKW